MPSQQERFSAVRLPLVQSQGTLFGQFVKSGVETFTGFAYKRPPQTLDENVRVFSSAYLVLESAYLAVQFAIPGVWRQQESDWTDGMNLFWGLMLRRTPNKNQSRNQPEY